MNDRFHSPQFHEILMSGPHRILPGYTCCSETFHGHSCPLDFLLMLHRSKFYTASGRAPRNFVYTGKGDRSLKEGLRDEYRFRNIEVRMLILLRHTEYQGSDSGEIKSDTKHTLIRWTAFRRETSTSEKINGLLNCHRKLVAWLEGTAWRLSTDLIWMHRKTRPY